jgi:hypothetical protein
MDEASHELTLPARRTDCAIAGVGDASRAAKVAARLSVDGTVTGPDRPNRGP